MTVSSRTTTKSSRTRTKSKWPVPGLWLSGDKSVRRPIVQIDRALATRAYADGYESYARVVEGLGFKACRCKANANREFPSREYRDGLLYCIECGAVIGALSHIYPCDECTEPTLAKSFPPPSMGFRFVCDDCR